MIPRGWIISAALAALVLSNGASLMRGKAWGERVANDRHVAAVRALESSLRKVTANAARAEAQRLEIERERNDLLAELDAQGRDDPDAGRRALGADSVSRINAIGR